MAGAVGAALGYFLDPELGRSRRERLQAQLGSTLQRGRREVQRVAGRAPDRARRLTPELDPPPAADDLTVLSRVESVLLEMPGFPRDSIELEVADGRLVLRGEVPSAQRAEEIAAAATRIPGVASVENQLRQPRPRPPRRARAPRPAP